MSSSLIEETRFGTEFSDELLERFLRYTAVHSASNGERADEGIQPSTVEQAAFAQILAQELRELHFDDVQVTSHSYVYARIPAAEGMEKVPVVCFCAHIDTVEEVCGANVKAQVHRDYDGRLLRLECDAVLDPDSDPELKEAGLRRETIITSDGRTLLGADDKAGLAEIVTAASFILRNALPHGTIEILFSPDEETGHGMDNVPLELISAKRCYTVDGGSIGELEIECFNAYKSQVRFEGRAMHTGTARQGMVNAALMAASFLSSLPHTALPETTDGRQGFFAPVSVSGTIESAEVTLLLRDFDSDGMEKRIALVEQLASATAASFGGRTEVRHIKQYLNMKQVLDKFPDVTESLIAAYRNCGIEPKIIPIRGGTDGSRLCELGIPTPNTFTGGHNFHSRTEWASLEQMCAAARVLVELCRICAKQ